MVHILRSTEAGHVDAIERETVDLYEYQDAMPGRETARIAVPGGEVHLDVYPSPAPRGDLSGGADTAKGTVVFVGGLSGHALQSARFLARLAQRNFNVVAFDPRGHGRSSGRRGDFTVDMLFEDAQAAIDYAKERFSGPVAFMGHSLGGYYTLAIAGRLTDVDLAISHWIFDPKRPVTRKDARMKPVALTLNRLVPWLRMSTRPLANWDAVSQSREIVERTYRDPLMVWKYSVRALAAGLTYNPPRPLNQLRVAHLVVIGEEDQMTPMSYTREIYDWLEGDKTFESIPGAGHMGGLNEFQDEMLDIVDGWLTPRMAALRTSARAVAGASSGD